MRKLVAAAIVLLAVAGSASANETFIAHLTSAKTGTGSPAEGTATFILSDDLTHVDYNVSYVGLLGVQTGCHVHRKSGGIIFDLGTGINPMIGTWNGILPEDINRLRTAELYINVHSDLYTTGEISGTLLPKTSPVESITWGRIKALYVR
jgi:CHRD domain